MNKRILDGIINGLVLLGLSGAFLIGLCFYLEVIFGKETSVLARIIFALFAIYWLVFGYKRGGGKPDGN